MRIALDQCKPALSADAGLARIATAARLAKAQGADLLIAPEMAMTGYNIGADRVAAAAQGGLAEALQTIARTTGIAILAGFPERAADGRIYNAAHLADRSGQPLATCRKTHLYGAVDRSQFSPGTAPFQPVQFMGWRIGIAICYDIEFPELARAMVLKGAEALLVLSANMEPFRSIPLRMVPTRAEENECYLAYANFTGAEPPFDYCGLSCICGPDGNDLARAGQGEEMIFATLSKDHLTRTRATSTHLQDRRPELYGGLLGGLHPGPVKGAKP